ncbi:anti-sigma factor [Leptolyngbya sp. PCC 6406]|uniref:anti-sigma factor n=1 Tax=Leptolyngbya sp. PCC 6406 TaxID=1173264 RepID=UPI0002AD05E3|nr:anti-sigma factor [Leptolyngbya sp. PCC 6406]
MTQAPLPENWRDILAGYVLGDLETEEVTLVRQWRNLYPEVRLELEALEETWNAIPAALPAQIPPPDLRHRILSTAAAATPPPQVPWSGTGPKGPLRSSSSSRPAWAWYGLSAGWAVTAVALAVVAMDNNQLRQEKQQVEAVVARFSQPRNPVYTLAGADALPEATGRLVIDANTQSVLIATQDLPPLPSDEAYRLWALADADPVYCGQFNPSDRAAMSEWKLLSPLCEGTSVQMLITRESVSAPPIPAGPLVLQGQPQS